MITEQDGESRIDYLLRVLDYFMESSIAGEITVGYDGTFCDGTCLAEDIRNAVDELNQ